MDTTQRQDVEIRTYRPGDETPILETFNLVFRQECGPDFVDRDLTTWNWLYRDNPAGLQVFLAVAKDGTIASHYAGIPQTADTDYGEVRFVHIVDSMTHPDYRQGLKKLGLFTELGRAFTADYDEHGNELGYGFPVRIAERIGRRQLDYLRLRVLDYLSLDANGKLLGVPNGLHAERVRSLPEDTDALWHRIRPELRCSVRRDRRYLDWRYVQNPEADQYEVWTARDANRVLRGLMVLRPRHELVPDSCTIADWVCPAEDTDAARLLAATAQQVAQRSKRTRVLAVFADTAPQWQTFRVLGFDAVPSKQWLERRLSIRITGPHLTPEFLEEHWSYTLGDTDLV